MLPYILFELGHWYILVAGLFFGLAISLLVKSSPFPKVKKKMVQRRSWLFPLLINLGFLTLLLGVFWGRWLIHWERDLGEWIILLVGSTLLAFLAGWFPRALGLPFVLIATLLGVGWIYTFQNWGFHSEYDPLRVAEYRYLDSIQNQSAWEGARGIEFVEKDQWPLESVSGYKLEGMARMLGGEALVAPLQDSKDGFQLLFLGVIEFLIPQRTFKVQKYPVLEPYYKYQYQLKEGELLLHVIWPAQTLDSLET